MTTAARLEATERGLSGIAKKVLEATPIGEPWPIQKIASELSRLQGSSPRFDVVQGCLSHLREVGLVKEPERLKFQRVHAAPRLSLAKPAQKDEPMPQTQTTATAEPPATIDQLAALAATARRMAVGLNSLADEIEAAAIDFEERLQQAGKDGEKLRQLQALLKGI